MSSEIEIKLEIKNEDLLIDIIEDEKIKNDYGSFSIISMNAIYFDTRDLDLLQNNYVIRIRKENGVKVCTLKKKKKELDSGVLIRDEWNKEIITNSYSLDYFPEVADKLNDIVKDKKLVEIIETDFIRRKIDINYKSSQLEFAVDYGKIKSNNNELPILEVEIELKKGLEKDILDFIDEYLTIYNLNVVTYSKFSRGVELFKRIV